MKPLDGPPPGAVARRLLLAQARSPSDAEIRAFLGADPGEARAAFRNLLSFLESQAVEQERRRDLARAKRKRP